MADGKKSFVLYCDIIHVVKKLPKDKAGELFFTILEYVNDMNPVVADFTVELVFEPIKQQLKRDLIKWEGGKPDRIEKAKKAGLASGEARRIKHNSVVQNELGSSKTNLVVQNELGATKRTANVNVTVNDTVNTEFPKETESMIVVEKETNDSFFYFFRRAAGSHISDKELRQEVGKFRNKYPNIHANQSGALINAWVSNIGKEKTSEKKMVL